MASSEPSRKRAWEEDDDDESRRRRLVKEGTTLAPNEEPEEVLPHPPNEPMVVPSPLPEEVSVL
jgi:hypothetical protein